MFRIISIVVGLIPILFLGLFYFYPLAGIFIRSFFEQSNLYFGNFSFTNLLFGNFSFSNLPFGNFSLLNLLKIFQSSRIIGIIWFTWWQAFVSTILTLIFAMPCAWVMGSFHFTGKKLIMTLATLPFVLPTIVVAAAFQVISTSIRDIAQNSWIISFISGGNNTILNFIQHENSIFMILLVHIFYNFSVVLRIISSFWSSMGKEMKEAGSMLGANGVQIFFKIILPLLKPAILASSMLVFIFCFSSFGVILILGGPSFSTLEVEIYRQASHMFNLPVASCLSLFQIIFTFGMMCIYTLLQKKRNMFMPESEKFSLKKPTSFGEKIAVFLCIVFIISLCTVPIGALFIKSLYYKGSISLIFYRELLCNSFNSIFYVSPITAISNSLKFALSTLVMALVVGGCAACLIIQCSEKNKSSIIPKSFNSPCILLKPFIILLKPFIILLKSLVILLKPFIILLEPLFMLPLSTSAVILGFGIIITLDKPPLNLRTSVFLIPIIHTLVAFPFVVRTILPALRAIPSNLKEAASIMGAPPFRVWLHIELPIIARALSIGAVFAFTISLGEFGATLFAARPEFTTMPLTIYKFLGQPGTMNYGQAMAMSSILMFVTAVGFIFIENMRQFGHEF